MQAEMSIVVIFHRLGPYHWSRLSAAAVEMDVTCLELSAETTEYAWNKLDGEAPFERITLFTESDSRDVSPSELRSRLHAALDRVCPQVVVLPGWSGAASFLVLQWCVQNRVPAVVMSESTAWDDRRTRLKESVKRRVVSCFASALVGGKPHADYIVQLGMPQDKVSQGYDAVDNSYFSTRVAEIRSRKSEIRTQQRLPANFFLASARFIEKKNLPRLLQAYARYRLLAQKAEFRSRKSELWRLVLLGDGPLREKINSQLATLNLHGNVVMPGFKQYEDLPAYYGLANAFIHASTTEQWGLVVNEAMASGLPVLVSNRCGCAPDLVQEGVNGFTFDPSNVEQLAQMMVRFTTLGSDQRAAMGKASQRIISDWGVERFAQGLKDAVDCAIRVGPRRANIFDRFLLRALMTR